MYIKTNTAVLVCKVYIYWCIKLPFSCDFSIRNQSESVHISLSSPHPRLTRNEFLHEHMNVPFEHFVSTSKIQIILIQTMKGGSSSKKISKPWHWLSLQPWGQGAGGPTSPRPHRASPHLRTVYKPVNIYIFHFSLIWYF